MSQPNCIFCKIVAGEASANVVYRDGRVTAFRDIHPLAPTHILIVPDGHITSVAELTEEHRPIVGQLLLAAREVAAREGLTDSGFRLVVNSGADAGQAVHHLHMHLFGGRRLGPMILRR